MIGQSLEVNNLLSAFGERPQYVALSTARAASNNYERQGLNERLMHLSTIGFVPTFKLMRFLPCHLYKSAEIGRTHSASPAMYDHFIAQLCCLIDHGSQSWAHESEAGSNSLGLTLQFVIGSDLSALIVVQYGDVMHIGYMPLLILTLRTNVNNGQLVP